MTQLLRESPLPIVKSGELLSEHQLNLVPQAVLELMASVDMVAAPSTGPRLVKLLQCYLEVTGQTLDESDADNFFAVGMTFLGALNSGEFLEAKLDRRYVFSKLWLCVLRLGRAVSEVEYNEFRPSTRSVRGALFLLARIYEELPKVESACRIWRGWPAPTAGGNVIYVPLRRVYLKFGDNWTSDLFNCICDYTAGRHIHKLAGLNQFLDFICQEDEVTAASLQNPIFIGKFWHMLYYYYYAKTRNDNNVSNLKIIEDWNTQWRGFALDYLAAKGIVAQSAFSFPAAGVGTSRPILTDTPGRPNRFGMISVNIPMSVPDSEFVDLLFTECTSVLETIDSWALRQIDSVYSACKQRRTVCPNLEPRKVGKIGVNNGEREKTKLSNPRLVEYARATFQHHGYLTESDEPNLQILYPPLDFTATALGLPRTGTLLPFAAVLVRNHPLITPSFLEKLELYDAHGRIKCLKRQDGGWYLIGYKERKGARLAEQSVLLTRKTLRAVIKLIAVTDVARCYLRAKGDSNWRRLFISTGRGFGYPYPVDRFATDTSHPERVARIAQQLQDMGVEAPNANKIASAFTLRSLRKTAGIETLLGAHSEREVARQLGHHSHRWELISRYVPAELIAIFRARHIRAYQLTVLVHCSPKEHQLKATGFASDDALKKFIEVVSFHKLSTMLKAAPEQASAAVPETDDTDTACFVLEATPQTVSELRRLSASNKNCPPSWTSLAKALLSQMEERAQMDPYLEALLEHEPCN